MDILLLSLPALSILILILSSLDGTDLGTMATSVDDTVLLWPLLLLVLLFIEAFLFSSWLWFLECFALSIILLINDIFERGFFSFHLLINQVEREEKEKK
jgi:hypothetical protein